MVGLGSKWGISSVFTLLGTPTTIQMHFSQSCASWGGLCGQVRSALIGSHNVDCGNL